MRHPLITEDEVKHQFKTFDFNGDGFVTTTELHLTSKVFYHDNEYTEEDIDAMMAEADLNCDDKASYQGTVKLDHNPMAKAFFLRKKKEWKCPWDQNWPLNLSLWIAEPLWKKKSAT